MKNIVYPEKENTLMASAAEFDTYSIPQFEPVPMKKYNAISADDETTKDNEKSFFGPLDIKPKKFEKKENTLMASAAELYGEDFKKKDVDLYTYDEQRLIICLTDNGWTDSRIKEYINKVRAGEILGMTASKLLERMEEMDKDELHHESLKKKPDMVNHPPHYNVGGFEVIDIIKTFTEGLEGIEAVDTANAIKYILRWPRKNGVEDLKKAKWYIEHLIKEVEND